MSNLTNQLDAAAINQDIAREFRRDAEECKRLEADCAPESLARGIA
jgi:hypothetical protein